MHYSKESNLPVAQLNRSYIHISSSRVLFITCGRLTGKANLSTMGKANRYAGLVLLLIVLSIAGTTSGAPPKPSALFGFGDSYADTGNKNHSFPSFHYPYGITWPGYPTGRYSNGHLQTDYLAYKLGLPSPTPYVDIGNQSIATGINFALGGSGITFALGTLPLFTQVDHFELVLRTGAYSPSFLADSVTLISIAGNDHIATYTSEEFLVVTQEVVEGLTLVLTRIYQLGLRNILVANLAPINCFPLVTLPSNYTNCSADLAPLVAFHNELLLQSVAKLNTLPDANFLILNEMEAFTYVFNNTALYGLYSLQLLDVSSYLIDD
jgi:phospholipase/lecithinase/hemolysin